MSTKKIVILLGHPDKEAVCGSLADAYEEGARNGGHSVERYNIGEMHFDPILHKGYREIQELEPDLVRFQESLRNADHFVLIYPNWWSGPPAILKGLFDRAWLPGFACRYIKLKNGYRTPFWHRLLKGKTARLIVTTGAHPLFLRILYGHYLQQISVGILWFAGFKVEENTFGPAEKPSESHMMRWVAQVRDMGMRGK